ncbi:MAG: hypothetical protein ACR2QF_07035 [Geminicoccaceae bacterium]
MSEISEGRLAELELLLPSICGPEVAGTISGLIAEIHRLRAENARLKDNVTAEAEKMVDAMYSHKGLGLDTL